MTCIACQKNIQKFDYKNSKELNFFLNPELEIKKGRKNGFCKYHQRKISKAVKIARQMALLPFTPHQERKYGSRQ
ncbi:MAG: 30S ribosomal protein S18 [Patescibacteria group bacterium]